MQFFCFFHRNLFLQISWMLIRNFLQSRKNKLSVIKNCKYCWKNKVIICIIDYKSFLYKTLLIVDTFLLMQVYCNKNSFYLLLAHSFRKHQIKMPIMNIFFCQFFSQDLFNLITMSYFYFLSTGFEGMWFAYHYGNISDCSTICFPCVSVRQKPFNIS